jgi:hypothetical protein
LQVVGGVNVPKVWACLPSDWLCSSLIDGPQIPASQNTGAYANYDQIIAAELNAAINTSVSTSEPWLYDRAATFWKVYVRRGTDATGFAAQQKAYSLTELYKNFILPNGDFSLVPGDVKYVYAECLALSYMLSGDPTTLAKIETVGRRTTLQPWGTAYFPTQRWTARNAGSTWEIALHAYEITGNDSVLNHCQEYMHNLWLVQQKPLFLDSAQTRRHPKDGSWAHWWDDHDPDEATGMVGCSPWMTDIIIDAAWKYFLLTGDPRVPTMMSDWSTYLATPNYGLEMRYICANPTVIGTQGYYAGNWYTLGGGGPDTPDDQHNWEAALMTAGGYWAGGKSNSTVLSAFNGFFSGAPTSITSPPRMWSWALRTTAPFVWFMTTTNTAASMVNSSADTNWVPLGGGPIDTANTILCNPATAAPTINGNLGDAVWATADTIMFSSATNSVLARFLWDATNLYCGFDITDNVVTSPYPDSWSNDGIEFFISAPKGNPYVQFIWATGGQSWGPNCQRSQTTRTGGFIQEWAIPWTALPAGSAVAYSGSLLSVNVVNEDCDGGAEATGYSYKNVTPWKNPALYIPFALVGTTAAEKAEAKAAADGVCATPNPFNPSTVITQGGLAPNAECKISIYGLDGKLVQRFSARGSELGRGISWNAASHNSGVYIINITAGAKTSVKKVMLIK